MYLSLLIYPTFTTKTWPNRMARRTPFGSHPNSQIAGQNDTWKPLDGQIRGRHLASIGWPNCMVFTSPLGTHQTTRSKDRICHLESIEWPDLRALITPLGSHPTAIPDFPYTHIHPISLYRTPLDKCPYTTWPNPVLTVRHLEI